MNACSSDRVILPNGAQMMWFGFQAQHSMMQDRFEDVLTMCVTGNSVLENLVANGVARDSLPRAAQDMFDTTMLEQVGLLTEKDALLPTSESERKMRLTHFATETIKAFYSYYDDYLFLL